MAIPPPTPRKTVLVHVPADQSLDTRTWQARRVLLSLLGWRGTIGLCPLPPSPALPTQGRTPAMTALSALGIERAYGVRGLGLTMANPDHYVLDAAVREFEATGSLEGLRNLLIVRDELRFFDEHLDALMKRVREYWAEVTKEEALFIVSEHSWLLLAIAAQLCARTQDRVLVSQLPINTFLGVGLVHANGHWGGFTDLSPDKSLDWYLAHQV